MLLGLLEPSAGSIRILGEDMPRHRARVLPRMNFTSPYVDLPHRLTVRQNLKVYADLYAVDRARERIEELARDLDLATFLDRPFGRLSAGQKTRVLLAKALINEPELLLLDEPTASLDPDTADLLRGHLERYQARTHATLLLASHNMGEVERLAHRVLMLRKGRLVDQGSPADLLTRYGRDDLEEVFLDIARDRRRPEAAP
jgi:ABC-2 type transport system ATP-binding protein